VTKPARATITRLTVSANVANAQVPVARRRTGLSTDNHGGASAARSRTTNSRSGRKELTDGRATRTQPENMTDPLPDDRPVRPHVGEQMTASRVPRGLVQRRGFRVGRVLGSVAAAHPVPLGSELDLVERFHRQVGTHPRALIRLRHRRYTAISSGKNGLQAALTAKRKQPPRLFRHGARWDDRLSTWG